MSPRWPSATAAQVLAALKRAGFREEYQKGSHLYLRHFVTGRRTSVPMHARDLTRSTFKKIIKQTGLTEDEFRQFL